MAINSLRPLKSAAFDYGKAQHLLNRAGFGGTPSQVRALAEMGLPRAVDFIVDYEQQAYRTVRADEFDADIMRPASDEEQAAVRAARRRGDEKALEQLRVMRQQAQVADRRQIADVQRWWLTRLIETPRPLEEKMTLFWHGHFATGYRKIEDSYHMFLQNELLRAHAVGNFKKLTHAVIRDPAMIRYLDNHQNRRGSPNENLARELMELFTLGEGHDYTEDDIKEAARALTGYTYEDDDFQFRRQAHDPGEKAILGRSGDWDGDDLVDLIFERTSAAEHIVWKWYRYFVNDLPGLPDADAQGFIRKLGAEFRKQRFELRSVLKTLFLSEHFYDPANVACQVKSPIQLIVQAVRSLRTPVRQLATLLNAADLMGQNLLFPPSVKGWDGGRSWINTSTMFVRQNILIYLLTGRRPNAYPWDADGALYDATHLVAHLDGSARAGADDATVRNTVVYLLRFNFGADPHPRRVDHLVDFVKARGGALDNATLVGLLSLITAMPEYQLC